MSDCTCGGCNCPPEPEEKHRLEVSGPENEQEMLYRQALTHGHAGELDQAEALLCKLLASTPDHFAAHVELGAIYLQQGKLDEAIAENEAASTVNPDHPVPFVNLAAAFIQKGDFDRAINDCEEALFIDPKYADAYKNLSWAYLEKGEFKSAAAVSKKLMELEPDSGLARNNLAVALFYGERYAEALQAAHEALERGYPVHPGFYKDLTNRAGAAPA